MGTGLSGYQRLCNHRVSSGILPSGFHRARLLQIAFHSLLNSVFHAAWRKVLGLNSLEFFHRYTFLQQCLYYPKVCLFLLFADESRNFLLSFSMQLLTAV